MSSPRTALFVTVDTEEDNWGDYSCRSPSVSNVTMLPALQALCDRYGVVPTYLANWPVVAGDSSRDVLRELAGDGRCEIGTHVHPWNTPPVIEETGPRHSMLCNLPDELIASKLSGLHSLMIERLRATPVSFRAGRWGFSRAVAETLLKLGYRVDSSVSPFVDWTAAFGPDYRAAPTHAYRFRPAHPLQPAGGGDLVEIPATIGFLGARPQLGMRLRAWAFRPLPRRLRMVGVLDRLGWATLRWLSPEVATGKEMIKLARVLVGSGARFLNLTFHSPTLVPGLTPFVRTDDQLREFLDRIEEFLDFARTSGFRSEPLHRGPEVLGLADEASGIGRT